MGQKERMNQQIITHIQQITLLDRKADALRDIIMHHDSAIDYLMDVRKQEVETDVDKNTGYSNEFADEANHRMTAIDTRIDAITSATNAEIYSLKEAVEDMKQMIDYLLDENRQCATAIQCHAEVINSQNKVIDTLRYGIPEDAKKVQPCSTIGKKRTYVKTGKHSKQGSK